MQQFKPFDQKFRNVNLIEAGAGTGKTYNITALYLRYLIESDLSAGQILVVTFTRAATAELKERLLSVIQRAIRMLQTGKNADDSLLESLSNWIKTSDFSTEHALDKLKKAERNFNSAQIFTIHAFCNKVLQNEAFRSGYLFDTELIEGDRNKELALEATDDYWRSLNGPENVQKALPQYVSGKYGCPENLLDEIYPFLGKPYLKITPDNLSLEKFETALIQFRTVFKKLKTCWADEKEIIHQKMRSSLLKRYTNNAESRMNEMDGWIQTSFPPNDSPKTLERLRFFRQSVISTKLKKAHENENLPQHPFFDLVDEIFDIRQEVDRTKGAYFEVLLKELRTRLRQKKLSLQAFSYDDVLIQLHHALTDDVHGSELADILRKKFPVALVDEFQDTDPVQYEIFKKIYAAKKQKTRLFMVGDPKQAIYNFRGADIFVYLKARKDVDERARFRLSHNFRSVPSFLKGVNYLFSRVDNPFILEDIPYGRMQPGRPEEEYHYLKIDDEVHQPIQFWNLSATDESRNKAQLSSIIEKTVADEIRRLVVLGAAGRAIIGPKPLKAGDIAVLVRKHEQGEAVRQELLKRKIKCTLISKTSVFATDEAFELELVMRAISDPGDERVVSAALAARLFGMTGEEIQSMGQDETARVQKINQFSAWNEQWKSHSFAFVFRSILQEKGITARLLKTADGERRLTNLHHLGELLQQHEYESDAQPHGLIKWLAGNRKVKQTEESRIQLRPESDDEQVIISTLHTSKGLEYPIVFCPYLWQGPAVKDKKKYFIFHNNQKEALLNAHANGEERALHLYQRFMEDLSEEMRLAYVGMTRSRQCCYIPWVEYNGRTTNSFISPLGILLHGRHKGIQYIEKKTGLKSGREAGVQTHDEVFSAINKEAGDYISVTAPAHIHLEEVQRKTTGLNVKKWKGSRHVLSTRQFASFSSLSNKSVVDVEQPDYEQWVFQAEVKPEIDEKPTVLNFPRGLQTGRCVHVILEKLDFSSPIESDFNDAIIREQLRRHGFGKKWEKPMKEALSTMLNRSLLKKNNQAKLSKLSPENELREMEFHFPVQAVKTADLLQIIRGKPVEFPVQSGKGFMKGFIDLIIRFDSRFYVLDYKSNYLGDEYDDYNAESMRAAVQSHLYDLQYHIYTVAVHRFLQQRLTDYTYKKHFGGVLYLFIRGLNENNDNGIYFDRPSFYTIDRLNGYLKGGGVV